jgi:hypothetical protein
MRHCLALCFPLVLFSAAPAAEQEPPDWTIRLSVAPAAAPSPALRFPLLPELRDTSPGNAALLYYRSFSPEWLTHRRPEESKKLNLWRDDTSKAPANDLRWVLTYKPLREVDLAARRVYCDWELNERARKEGMSLLLPDVQSMRDFASLLTLRARFEMDAGEHVKVLHTLQTGLAMARHVGEAPTLIQALVAMAISQIMLGEVDRWIEKPGAPNLYWSLTNLPTPYIDLRKPLQGERFFLENLFPGLREAMAQRKPSVVPTGTLRNVLREVEGMRRESDSSPFPEFGTNVGLALYAAKVYPQAKKALLEQGWKQKEIEALSVVQAALMLEILNYDRVYDDTAKWCSLPYWQSYAGLERTERQLKKYKAEGGVGMVLGLLLVPATMKVTHASARVDRKIAALRTIETLRMYAAAHDGKLPARLADITDVPIPIDPITGKEFSYRVDDGKAYLSGPPPGKEQAHQANTIKYEITIKK